MFSFCVNGDGMRININMRRFGTWFHLLGKSHMSGGDLCEESSHWGNILRRYTDAHGHSTCLLMV